MLDEPIVRMSRPNDINDIRDLDIKCYDYPLSMPEWQELINGKEGEDDSAKAKVAVIEVYRKKAGFAVYRKVDEDTVEIVRLGVRESLRASGLGALLIKEAELYAKRMACDVLRLVVPEIHCQPEGQRDKDDVSQFLNHNQFKPTGKIVSNFAYMYGEDVDGFVWERKVL